MAHFNSTYPFGIYTFNLSNSSTLETATASTNYTRDAYTADIPALTSGSFNALQGANPSLGMTIGFNAFTPSANATEGFAFFSIFPVGGGSSVYSAGFLDPSATSALVPANTLLPNTTYGYELDFSDRFADLSSSTNATQGFDVRTDGTFTTSAVPEPGAAGVMVVAALMAGRRRRRAAV